MRARAVLSGVAALAALWALPGHAELYQRDQAVAYALGHNPELLAAREQSAVAGARKDAARGARLPQLGFTFSARASDNPLDAFADKLNTASVTSADFDPAALNNPGTSRLYMGQLALRVPIYTGGRLAAQSESATEAAKNADLQYQRAREITAFNARRAYLIVQYAEQGLAIADDAVAAARQHADTTARLVREGRTVVSDRLTAQVNLAAMESQRAQAATRLERARNQLKLVMGLPLDSDVEVEPYADTAIAARPGPQNPLDLESTALAQRQDLAGMRAMLQSAKARIDAARAAHLPQVDLIAARNHYDNTDARSDSSSVMGVLSLDLYSGGRSSAGVSEAAAEEKQAEWQTLALEQQVRSDVRNAYDNLQEAKDRNTIAEGNVERARENVRQVNVRYGQGRTILIDLLQAERALVEARNEELVSRLNLETGYAALDLSTGTLALPAGDKP